MSKYEFILSISEIALLEGLVELLDVFNVFTVFIQGCEYPTMNTIVLFFTEIEDRLKKIQLFNLNEIISNATRILLDNLPKRIEILNEYIAAALIDPRMQHLDIVSRWISDKGNALLCFKIQSNWMCLLISIKSIVHFSLH